MSGSNEILPFIVIILLAVVLPLLIILLTSGNNIWKALNNIIINGIFALIFLTLSGGLIIFGVIIAYSKPKAGKRLAYIGIAGVLLCLIFFEVFVAETAGKNRFKEEYVFKECEKIPVIKDSVVSIPDSLSCLITGYLPKNYSKTYLIGFWIFGIMIPIIVLCGIFLDLVESSGIIKNNISQRLIGWGLGLMAYRGFVVSNLIYIIDFFSAGMALIVLNFIFVGGLLAYTNRVFSQWKTIEDAIRLGKSQAIAAKNAKVVLEQALRLAKNGADIEMIKNNYLTQFEYVFRQSNLWGQVLNLLSENDRNNFITLLQKIIDSIR